MTTDESSAHKRAMKPEGGDGGDGDNWVMDVGRGLGFVARSFVDGIDLLWQKAEVAGPRSHRQAAGESGEADRKKLDTLLKRLGEIVSAHSDRGYTSLAEDEEFGRLLTRLYLAWQRAKRSRRLGKILARRRTKGAVSDLTESRASEPTPAAAPEPAEPAIDLKDADAAEEVGAPVTEEDPLAGVLEEALGASPEDEQDESKNEQDESKNEKRGKAGKKQG